MTTKFVCVDGPYDGRVFEYPSPAPNVVVIPDAALHYHEYHRLHGPHRVGVSTRGLYRWERSYRIRADDPNNGEVHA